MSGGLVTLFIGSLLASTVLPGGVEGLLYYLVQAQYHALYLLTVATAGNTIGGIITYGMGALLARGLARTAWHTRVMRGFQLTPRALQRVRKWGVPALLLSWLPLIGDPLCLAAGYIGLRFWVSATMILLGKLFRYAVLLWLYTQPWASVAVGG